MIFKISAVALFRRRVGRPDASTRGVLLEGSAGGGLVLNSKAATASLSGLFRLIAKLSAPVFSNAAETAAGDSTSSAAAPLLMTISAGGNSANTSPIEYSAKQCGQRTSSCGPEAAGARTASEHFGQFTIVMEYSGTAEPSIGTE